MLHEQNVRKVETFAYRCAGDVNERAMEEIIGGVLQGEPRERKGTLSHVERESVHIPLPGNQIMLLEISFRGPPPKHPCLASFATARPRIRRPQTASVDVDELASIRVAKFTSATIPSFS